MNSFISEKPIMGMDSAMEHALAICGGHWLEGYHRCVGCVDSVEIYDSGASLCCGHLKKGMAFF